MCYDRGESILIACFGRTIHERRSPEEELYPTSLEFASAISTSADACYGRRVDYIKHFFAKIYFLKKWCV